MKALKIDWAYGTSPEGWDLRIPTVRVTWEGGEGYLQPFRGYCFQVSSDPRDGSSLGSSAPEFRYRELVGKLDECVLLHILRADCLSAIAELCARRGLSIPDLRGWNLETEYFNDWIRECYVWLVNHEDWLGQYRPVSGYGKS